jgi:hypothetical protein
MHEHGPLGALVAKDDESARLMHEAIRRAQRDNVRADLRGVGLRFGRIAAGLRGPADRLERADPAHTVIRYGPRGLYQCNITITSLDSKLSLPMAFALQMPPKPTWDATLRGSVYDVALTISLRRSGGTNVWWYRLGQPPWSNRFYASADGFYNNGQGSGPLKGTPKVDRRVPPCP